MVCNNHLTVKIFEVFAVFNYNLRAAKQRKLKQKVSEGTRNISAGNCSKILSNRKKSQERENHNSKNYCTDSKINQKDDFQKYVERIGENIFDFW